MAGLKGHPRQAPWVVIPTVHGHDRVQGLVRDIWAGTVAPEGVIIVDNHPGADQCDFPAGQYDLVKRDVHLGSAGSFEEGFRFAIRRSAKWIWLLDDDAGIRKDTLEFLVNAAEDGGDRTITVPNTNGSRSGQKRLGTWCNPLVSPSSDQVPQLVPWSGMLLAGTDSWLEMFRGLSDTYWFGWDDYAFTTRAIQHMGYSIGCVWNAWVSQPQTNHTPTWKTYYMSRNGVLFASRELKGFRRLKFLTPYLLREIVVRGIRDRSLLVRLIAAVHAFVGKTGHRFSPQY